MSQFKPFLFVLLAAAFLAGCSSVKDLAIENALENASRTSIEYNSQCQNLKLRCRPEDFREWQTSSGEPGCSCEGGSRR